MINAHTSLFSFALAAVLAAGCAHAAEPSAATRPAAVKVDFATAEVGKAAPGFTPAAGGPGKPGEWVVQQHPDDAKARVLVQTSTDATDKRYPMCVYDAFTGKDVTVGIRFRTVSGEVDQAAGIVVRYKDAKNYYVARANALENNVRFYRVTDGTRQQIAGSNVEVAPGKWQSLTLTAKGGHFAVSFNDKLLYEADDATFADAGKVGLWTKADSVTQFTAMTIEGHEAAK